MLQAGAIYENHAKNLVLSSIYTVPKKDSKDRRPVINLRWVNSHIIAKHFKMTTLKDVKAAITKGCFMAKIDLKDCFWQLPVRKDHQRFLSFRWRGKNYSFRCLPFGLNVSPRFITKLYKPVVSYLQQKGLKCLIYIDDMILFGNTQEECSRAVEEALSLFAQLGVVVNAKKSVYKPATTVDYLGFTLDSVNMTISAPPNKIKNVKKEVRKFLNRPASSPRQLASILGKINSLADALFPARVHTASLHQFKVDSLKRHKGWDHLFSPPAAACKEAKWWLDHLSEMNGRSLIPPPADIQMGTDASGAGWGAWIENKHQADKPVVMGAYFDKTTAPIHINFKELTAAKYALQSCKEQLKNKVIALATDNMTTLFYINRMGGRNFKLASLAAKIWDICRKMHATIFATHIAGVRNNLADELSRKRLHTSDLRLNPSSSEWWTRTGAHTQ